MQELYGQCRGSVLILHGGAGSQDPGTEGLRQATADLASIAAIAVATLQKGCAPLDVVVDCLKAMELNERFNAGRGAALQADGQARLTAALMSGPESKFSSVISASYITHPSLVARHLQSWNGDARVLTTPGSDIVARQLGLPVESNVTPERLRRWYDRCSNADWTADSRPRRDDCDTVGCILRTENGELFAGTSTGGRGFEFPGRVSDSGTIAGTFASSYAAVSATGVGEEIVDDALAPRLETRCRDGGSIADASRKCFNEAKALERSYGWIALDRQGGWAAVTTTPAMSFVVFSTDGGKAASS